MALVKLNTRINKNSIASIKAYLFEARNKKGHVHTRIMFKLSEKMLKDMELEVHDKIEFLIDTDDSTQFAITKNMSCHQSLKIGKTGRNFTLNIRNFSPEIRDKYEKLGTTVLDHEIIDDGTTRYLKFKM